MVSSVIAALEQQRWLRNTLVVIGATLISATATDQLVHRSSDGKYVVIAVGTVLALSALVRWLPPATGVIVLLTAVVPYPVSFVGKTPFGVVTAAGAMAFALVAATGFVVDRDRRRLPHEPGIRLLLLWVAWSIASAATSAFPKVAINEARQVLFAMPLAYLAGRAIGARRPRVMDWCLMAISAVSFLALVQAVTGFDPIHLLPGSSHFPLTDPGESYRFGQVRVRVGYYHASDLGRVLAVALPFMIVRAMKRGAPAWSRVGLALNVVALGLTLTFTAWLAAAVAVGVLIMASPVTRRQAAAAAGVVAVAVGLGAGGSVTHLVSARLNPSGSNLAEQHWRLALIPASIHYAATHRLLGSGPGTFTLIHVVWPIGGVPIALIDDSTFTARLIEEGYPGLILFVAGLAVLAASLWKHRGLPYYPAVLGGLAGWVTAAATVDALVRDAPLLAAWLLLGVGAGVGVSLHLESSEAVAYSPGEPGHVPVGQSDRPVPQDLPLRPDRYESSARSR